VDGAPEPDAAPPGALPHGPLRITAAFEASVAEPLPLAAERLREALFAAAREGLGLPVEVVDLEVAGLLDENAGVDDTDAMDGMDDMGDTDRVAGPDGVADGPGAAGPALPGATPPPRAAAEAAEAARAVEAAVRAVPGVVDLAGVLPGGSGLRVRDTRPPGKPGRRVQIQLMAAPHRHALTVGRLAAEAARTAAAPGAPGPVLASVLITSA
jgi:hypothetical protein